MWVIRVENEEMKREILRNKWEAERIQVQGARRKNKKGRAMGGMIVGVKKKLAKQGEEEEMKEKKIIEERIKWKGEVKSEWRKKIRDRKMDGGERRGNITVIGEDFNARRCKERRKEGLRASERGDKGGSNEFGKVDSDHHPSGTFGRRRRGEIEKKDTERRINRGIWDEEGKELFKTELARGEIVEGKVQEIWGEFGSKVREITKKVEKDKV
ncbi:hypothetical protein G5I_03710 [Acromyrmex echinatior]|uniref:Uncharacterized protein n=1 Tax=Acromyrmex echinatior TaxID=103372 RepID=F4WDQ2_ACREC|nr:hypothetical protein G5I_03710 [Acromyrmex echinatior]